jgi:hypothetical protein
MPALAFLPAKCISKSTPAELQVLRYITDLIIQRERS